MAASDLTSLANVKAWLNLTVTNDDVLLARLITSVSQKIYQYVNRNFIRATYTEKRNGSGSQTLAMGQWPILSVASLSINGVTIPPSPDGLAAGFVFDERFIYVLGMGVAGRSPVYVFNRGFSNVAVTYTAGYQLLNDQQTIPASGPYTIGASSLIALWKADLGVTYASTGASLALVPSAPSAGQYSVSATGTYTFSAADTGKGVLISYAHVPNDVEQACIEWVAHSYKGDRPNVGVKSKSLGGENVVFDKSAIPDNAMNTLNNYRKMVPI